MPSGKQISFEFGEVSPSLQFKSDAVSYAAGLAKLKNMYVRKEGGVSNRAGFKFIRQTASQQRIPARGERANYKGFTYFDPDTSFIQSIEDVSEIKNISSISNPSGTTFRYNLSTPLDSNWAIGNTVVIAGCSNANNNGSKVITALGASSFDVTNASGVVQAGAAGTVDSNVGKVYVDNIPELVPDSTTEAYIDGCSNVLNNTIRKVVRVEEDALILNPKTIAQPEKLGVIRSEVFGGKGRWAIMEYVPGPAVSVTTPNGTTESVNGHVISIDQTIFAEDFTSPYLGLALFSTPPSKIRFTALKNKVLITPALRGVSSIASTWYAKNVMIPTTIQPFSAYYDVIAGNLTLNDVTGETLSMVSVTKDWVSGTLQANAAYLITAVLYDGREVEAEYKDTSMVGAIQHPHAELSLKFTFTLSGAVPDVKHFNVYRAAGEQGYANRKELLYSFVGRVQYDGSTTTLNFADYGAGNPAVTPPLDDTMLDSFKRFSAAECAVHYQQRLVVGVRHNATPFFKSGDLFASKLGAPEQLEAPTIYSDTGAFQFSIPIQDGTPVVGLLSIQALVAMTEKGIYLVRGADGSGQGGVITPTAVNPTLISSEGCSSVVEPKSTGTKGFFINSSHTKLMAIAIGADGGADIAEASLFSNHLLSKGIAELAVLGTSENSVYLLTREGKLICATLSDAGSFGFSTMETDGYIESIFTGKSKREYFPNTVVPEAERYHDVLMAYVIRNGVRTLEQMVYREDEYSEGEFFADCFSAFGQRLADDGDNGYSANVMNYSPNPGAGEINIEDDGNGFLAGQEVKLNMPAVNFADDDFVLHFFYENAEGETCTTRFISNGNAKIGNFYRGYFIEDVPTTLQDVDSQSISAFEKAKKKTRWLPAFNKITGDDALLGPWIASNFGANPVSVVADGKVISSPNNPNKDSLYITEVLGVKTLELGDYYCYGYVGVPYTSEFETLDIEHSDQKTLSEDKKLINAVGVGFNNTKGGFFGIPSKEYSRNVDPLTQMEEIVYRDDGSFNVDTGYLSGYLEVKIPSAYTKSGRVNIKHVDPSPISILSVYPKGVSGG